MIRMLTAVALCLVSAALALPSNDQGRMLLGKVSNIVGGGLAGVGNYPMMVALFDEAGFVCGGTLIHHQVILTAGHCTREFKLLGAKIGANNWLLDDIYGRVYYARRFKKTITHPNYNLNKASIYGDIYGDVSLIVLSEPVPDTVPLMKLLAPGQKIADNLTAIGYGSASDWDIEPSHDLRIVSLEQITRKDCKSLLKKYGNSEYQITSETICAGRLEGGKDTCYGDSGGPLFIKNRKDINGHVQVGITSFGEGCAEKNLPAGYSSVRFFYDWITTTLEANGFPLAA